MKPLRRFSETVKDYCGYTFNFKDTPPNQVILFVTSACNFACETCFYSEKLNDTRNDLTFDELEKISSNFKEIKLLLMTGGEPYLRKDFFEIIRLFYDKNNTRKIHIPTNGFATTKILLDTERMLSELPGLQINIGVSLDGLHQRHDQISKRDGAFEKAITTQRLLIELEHKYANLQTRFYTVISHSNVEHCADLFKYISDEFGYERIGFSPLRGDPADPQLRPPSLEEWDAFTAMYRTYVDQNSHNSSLKQLLLNRKIRNLYSINRQIMETGDGGLKKTSRNFVSHNCSAGNNICTIDADGEVRVCELKEPVGNLRDHNYDIREILSEKFSHDCTCTHACFQNASVDVNPRAYLTQFL